MIDIKNFTEEFENIPNKQDATEIMTLLRKINELISKDQENFIELCYYFKKLKEHFESFDKRQKFMYYNAYENKNGRWYYEKIIKEFGLSISTINKMIQVVNRFTEPERDVALKIRSVFSGYNKTKLFELLRLSDAQIQKAMEAEKITKDSSVLEIRQYIKSVKNGENTEKDLDEDYDLNDIPLAFNPNTHYEFNYFDSKTKNQLVNICVEYQKAYFKLKDKKVKK